MKQAVASAIFMMLTLSTNAASTHRAVGDKTVTKVVKLLQGILDASKKTGEEERTDYAKFMCDCDKRSTEYKTTIETSEEQITLLTNQIAQLKADNSKLSIESAKLKAAIAANLEAQSALNSTRSNEQADFELLEQDLTGAIGQLEAALATLMAVSADQTSAVAKDHTKFMAGYETKYNPAALLKVKSALKTASAVATAFLDEKGAQKVSSFMQAPFTGSYTSQATEVYGILANMKDTFTSNLKEATAHEKAQIEAYKEIMKIKLAEEVDMKQSYDKKQSQLSSNDDLLGTKKLQKKETESTMAEAEQFLETTEATCAAKKDEYSKRRTLQAEEEAAISEAIAVLDSDAAFATFGTVTATSKGTVGFLQLKSIQKHSADKDSLRSQLMQRLQKVKGSKRLSKLLSLVQATNVFDVVLKEISKMQALIVEEGEADKQNLEFCNTERAASDKLVGEKTQQIEEVLNPAIQSLITLINDPETGLKKKIADDEASLVSNRGDQKEATDQRKEANLLYQEDRKNLAEAKSTLTSAISILQTFYSKLAKELKMGFVQKQKQPKNTPVPTVDTAVLKMEGESSQGNTVVGMLNTILDETKQEELQAIYDEGNATDAYETTMTSLKGLEKSLETSKAGLEESLAESEKNLLMQQQELKTTEEEKAAALAYLADIKPGCDFISFNIGKRDANRAEETAALEAAVGLIKGTPTYQNYLAEAHLESLGTCVAECKPGEEKAECKACLADVTVVAYCAGHPDTAGCTKDATLNSISPPMPVILPPLKGPGAVKKVPVKSGR